MQDFKPHERPLKMFDSNTVHSTGYFFNMAGGIYVGGRCALPKDARLCEYWLHALCAVRWDDLVSYAQSCLYATGSSTSSLIFHNLFMRMDFKTLDQQG